jgi:undecaprenyl pyrophosphate synthase
MRGCNKKNQCLTFVLLPQKSKCRSPKTGKFCISDAIRWSMQEEHNNLHVHCSKVKLIGKATFLQQHLYGNVTSKNQATNTYRKGPLP